MKKFQVVLYFASIVVAVVIGMVCGKTTTVGTQGANSCTGKQQHWYCVTIYNPGDADKPGAWVPHPDCDAKYDFLLGVTNETASLASLGYGAETMCTSIPCQPAKKMTFYDHHCAQE